MNKQEVWFITGVRLLLLCLLASTVRAQTIFKNQLVIGTVDSLYSSVLKEKETFWIGLPTNFNNPRFAKRRYPVIYVLDGDANFSTVASMARQLSVRNGNSVLPEVIVVGVLNRNRTRDFTPYPSAFWIYPTPSPLENTGGGESFAVYLHDELFRRIDSLYPTLPFRVLIGHSLGGLAATNMLINHPGFFNGYVVIDPSMWYDNQGVLRQVERALTEKRFDGTSLYLAIANSLPFNMDTITLFKDTSMTTLHPRSVFQYSGMLRRYSKNGLRSESRYYKDDTHMSLPLSAEYDGLRFLFDFYRLPNGMEARFLDPSDPADPAQLLTAHFERVSAQMGFLYLPPESLVNIYANTLLDNYLPAKALSLYQLNVKNYPDSYGARESLADFYKWKLKNPLPERVLKIKGD